MDISNRDVQQCGEIRVIDMTDLDYMAEALTEALAAYEKGECPVGALLVIENEILARSGNREFELHDATAHAEILVIREAGRLLKRDRFPDYTVYTTLAPCPMCEGALLQAQIPRIVYGSRSFRWIKEVRFARDRLDLEGPLMQRECRNPFVQWVKDIGRTEILDSEDL